MEYYMLLHIIWLISYLLYVIPYNKMIGDSNRYNGQYKKKSDKMDLLGGIIRFLIGDSSWIYITGINVYYYGMRNKKEFSIKLHIYKFNVKMAREGQPYRMKRTGKNEAKLVNTSEPDYWR